MKGNSKRTSGNSLSGWCPEQGYRDYMISGKVNNVTVVTEVILHAPGMTNVVTVAVGVGTLSQETVSFCISLHEHTVLIIEGKKIGKIPPGRLRVGMLDRVKNGSPYVAVKRLTLDREL